MVDSNLTQGNSPCNFDITNLAYTPVDVEKLSILAKDYDCPDRDIILEGFHRGFSLNYTGPREATESKNLKSAIEKADIVQQKINKEIAAGRVAGPFVQKPLSNLRTSPIGLVPKKSPGEYRLIHHLSYPKGDAVNDYIDPKLCSVQYTRFDEAVSMIQDLGRNCKLFKFDLKNAFRLLPVCLEDIELLGFTFQGLYYVDKCLPFGCSISCSLFEKFATFLEFCIRGRMRSGRLLHYLDDFLGGDRSENLCRAIMHTFQNCVGELNVPLAEEKSEGPSEIIVFLGLELDSTLMVIRIPKAKVEEVVKKIQGVLSSKKTTLREMQSLIGMLNFCCRAVVAGRPFCRRLINSICGLSQPHHRLRITSEIRLDLEMWLEFFRNYNGVSAFHDRFWVSNTDVQLFSDSAGGAELGFGIYFQRNWSYGAWPQQWFEKGWTKDITFLEIFPFFVALHIWGNMLCNKKIKFSCDNMAVVHIINSMTSKSKLVMHVVRAIAIQCLKFNILLKAVHIEGTKNSVCDALSRFQFERFRHLAPEAEADPYPIPDHLWDVCKTEPSLY